VRISLIVAMDRGGLIGTERGLPWRLPADLRRFRQLTTGKPIILGRTTFERIGGPLKDRLNIVLTRQPEFRAQGCAAASSLDEAFELAAAALPEMNEDEIMVIGGADVYAQSLTRVERIYLTIVDARCAGTVQFPLEAAGQIRFHISNDQRHGPDEKSSYGHRFLILDRANEGITIGQLLEGDAVASQL
jgi:dihydrofolate reductase